MPYAEGTTVPVERTRAEIERLITKYGATRFMSGWQAENAAINFVAHGCLVRFVLPLPTDKEAHAKYTRNAQQWKEAEGRRRWRCLLLAIKSKLEVVETGIETFEQSFLANIVTEGNITVYERIKLGESGMRLLAAPEG